MKLLALPLLLASVACAPKTMPETPSAACVADRVQHLVGQDATPRLLATAKRQARAGIVRKLVPGQIVTMEYRADRLDVSVDARNRVTRLSCG